MVLTVLKYYHMDSVIIKEVALLSFLHPPLVLLN